MTNKKQKSKSKPKAKIQKVKIVNEVRENRYREPKSATIKKASNGYIVNNYGPSGESNYVAKTFSEAQKHMKKLIDGGS